MADKRERTVLDAVKFPAVPQISAEIDGTYMIDYCVANKQVKWLQDEAQKTYTDKNGTERRVGMFQIRKAFVEKFYPDLVSVKMPDKNSLYARIMALK